MNTDTSDRKQIIIADDVTDNLKVLRNIFAGENYGIRISVSGEMALNSARKYPPDLILLDILMPGMDGYEVCRRLKADERTRDIPVIFISAINEAFNKAQAFSAGGVDYITKPFQTGDVLARVKLHLSLQDSRKRLEEKNAQLERAEKSLRRQNEYLAALHQTSLELLTHLNLDDLLRNILLKAADLSNISDGFIFLYDPEENELKLRFAIGSFVRHTGFRMKPGESLSGKCGRQVSPCLSGITAHGRGATRGLILISYAVCWEFPCSQEPGWKALSVWLSLKREEVSGRRKYPYWNCLQNLPRLPWIMCSCIQK